MEILVNRRIRTPLSTIGDLLINGMVKYHTLEDTDRGLNSHMTPDQIKVIKIKTKTAIPTGRYKVTSFYSAKHGGNVPLVNDVPGFDYIEIHAGNTQDQTDGCLLLGYTVAKDFVGDSKKAVADFYKIFFDAIKAGENVYITYQ